MVTLVSYLIWSTFISQPPLSPIWYGLPLSPNHYLLSRYGPPLSPNHYLLSDMVSHHYLLSNHYLLSDMVHLYLPTTISYPIWSTCSTCISQPLSPIWYGPPLSSNHYLRSDMVHLYLPTTISYPIWPPLSRNNYLLFDMVRSSSQPLSSIRYCPPLSSNHYLLSDMVHLYLPTTISYPIWYTFIS